MPERGRWRQQVVILAQELQRRGDEIGPMKCVGILLPASVSYIVSTLAVMKIG